MFHRAVSLGFRMNFLIAWLFSERRLREGSGFSSLSETVKLAFIVLFATDIELLVSFANFDVLATSGVLY